MYMIDNSTFRNLEEQVQKNKEDIAAHYNVDRVLADFGIKIIGQVTDAVYLPDPETFEGDYGDAYAVGASEPYSFYIWTRADANAGYPNDYWFNIGQLAIVGPEGPQGKTGAQGPKGEDSKWYFGSSFPSDANEGDFLLTSNGNVYYLNSDNTQVLAINIRGPQGIQGIQGLKGDKGDRGATGPQGPRGDSGGFINILGILQTTDQLPAPTQLNDLTKAFLVGTSSPYDLYIQIGYNIESAVWFNAGPLNVATMVTVGGEFQNIWDADTKVNVTDYAANDSGKYGLVKLGGVTNGIRVDTNGLLVIYPAPRTSIERQTSGYAPITPDTLAYSVKQALIKPELKGTYGANWTDTERQQAQNTLGFLTGEGAPTFTTVGYAGQIYTDTTTGTSYICYAIGLSGEGDPNGIVESDVQYQLYSDTLNQKMYVANDNSNRTKWVNAPSTVPYNPQVYCWAEIFRNLAYNGYYRKGIRANVIVGSGGGAGEEISIGQTDRCIDFNIGGALGFRMEGLANTEYVAFKPFPSSSNGRVDKTDLGTAEYPFRNLHLNGNVLLNGQPMPHVYKHLLTFKEPSGLYNTKVKVLSTSPELISKEGSSLVNFDNKVFAVDTTYRPKILNTQLPVIPLSLDINCQFTHVATNNISTTNLSTYTVNDELM